MNTARTYLRPVHQEDYPVRTGSQEVSPGFKPEAHYAPGIAQFRKFAVGTNCWFIADMVRGLTAAAGGMLEQMLPFGFDDFVDQSPEILFRAAHPDDLSHMFAFTEYWMSYYSGLDEAGKASVHPNIYIRLRNPSGTYYWAMIQYEKPITDPEGKFSYGLTMITDISHIKQEGVAMMSILDASDDSCRHFFCTDGRTEADPGRSVPRITTREREVLRLLAIGYSSKQISGALDVAANTVDNHRQSMLRKTGAKSTGELVAFGIKAGFV